MKKTWIVLKTEFINTITRRSFILTLILVPLVPALILGVMSLLKGKETVAEPGSSISDRKLEDQLPQGYIDLADMIKSTPEWLGNEQLIAYQKEADARQATLSGAISGYYVIQPDYMESGAVRYVSREYNSLTFLDSTWMINSLIRYNLLGGDVEQFDAFYNPVQVHYFDLEPDILEENTDISNPAAFYVPYGMTMLFYILIITSASLMMNNVAKEKENRVMEILVSSIKPSELLAGKIFGLGLVGLLQLVVWLGSALIMLRLGGGVFHMLAEIQLSPGILIWGIIFFVLGYLLYGTIMAGVGALVGSVKEASQATFIVILPILIPLMLVGPIIERPHSSLAVVLSLIPFTAPNTIMTRMAATEIPLWQPLTAIGLLIITAVFLIRAVAGMFKAQLLLTGQKFSLGLFINTLRGKHSEAMNT